MGRARTPEVGKSEHIGRACVRAWLPARVCCWEPEWVCHLPFRWRWDRLDFGRAGDKNSRVICPHLASFSFVPAVPLGEASARCGAVDGRRGRTGCVGGGSWRSARVSTCAYGTWFQYIRKVSAVDSTFLALPSAEIDYPPSFTHSRLHAVVPQQSPESASPVTQSQHAHAQGQRRRRRHPTPQTNCLARFSLRAAVNCRTHCSLVGTRRFGNSTRCSPHNPSSDCSPRSGPIRQRTRGIGPPCPPTSAKLRDLVSKQRRLDGDEPTYRCANGTATPRDHKS